MLGYIIALLVVGGLLFLAASFAFGRGEEMAPALPEGTPLELPDDRLADGDDLRALRLSVAVRGYRMDEVDWLLDTLARQVDTRDREIARLRSVLQVEPVALPDGEPELLTHPVPAVRDTPAGDDRDELFDQEADPGRRAAYGATRVTREVVRDPGAPRPGEPVHGLRTDTPTDTPTDEATDAPTDGAAQGAPDRADRADRGTR